MNPLDTTKRQVKNSTGQQRDCCLRSSYDFAQSPEHCSPTKYARVSRCSHGNLVMLFCPSFTESERFLQTDQRIIRLQVVVVTNFMRMLMRNVFVNVFKSDAVVWWAAIFFTTSSMFDKMLHLLNSKSSAMSCSRSCNFCEAVGNLLTVTMYLQDALSRFHRPGLHKIDLRVHVASASTRTLALHKSKSCRAVSAQHNHSRRAICTILLHWSLVAIPSQAPPTSAINSDSPELKQTMFCFLEDAYTGYHVFSIEPLIQTAIEE